jgi:hypothetical protein
MASTLNLIYGVVIALVAIVGYAYVLTQSDDGTGKETRWSDWTTIAAVTLFVVGLLWTTVF